MSSSASPTVSASTAAGAELGGHAPPPVPLLEMKYQAQNNYVWVALFFSPWRGFGVDSWDPRAPETEFISSCRKMGVQRVCGTVGTGAEYLKWLAEIVEHQNSLLFPSSLGLLYITTWHHPPAPSSTTTTEPLSLLLCPGTPPSAPSWGAGAPPCQRQEDRAHGRHVHSHKVLWGVRRLCKPGLPASGRGQNWHHHQSP